MKLLWLTAALVFVADQLTKHAVVQEFLPGESRIFIPHLMYWTYVQNARGAFGLFGARPWLLIALAVIVLALFWFAFRELAMRSKLVCVAFGAIVGGAFGNIADRILHHFVVDFIDFRWWPVFNVADSCITVGVALLVLATVGPGKRRSLARS